MRVLFLIWYLSCSETDFLGVLCGKAHCDAAKSTCPVNYMDYNRCPAMNILKLEKSGMLGWL